MIEDVKKQKNPKKQTRPSRRPRGLIKGSSEQPINKNPATQQTGEDAHKFLKLESKQKHK